MLEIAPSYHAKHTMYEGTHLRSRGTYQQQQQLGKLDTMAKMRIVVANEPRAYRDVIAAAFSILRPHVDVMNIEPDQLDSAVLRCDPHMVICSHRTATVEAGSFASLVLYPDFAGGATMCQTGKQTVLDDVTFDTLLAMVDQVDALVQLQ